MGEWRNAALQAAFWTYANSLRREAKLCDIILYVQGRKGAMVGYPAHKLLLISASKYFKLLFEREDLRNFCHFPHLSEDGLFTVLDIVYGHEIPDNVNLDDALMAARFLQVDCAVEELEAKRVELEMPIRSCSNEKKSFLSGHKRKASSQYRHTDSKIASYTENAHEDEVTFSSQRKTEPVQVKLFKNTSTSDYGDGDGDSIGEQMHSHREDSVHEDEDGGSVAHDSSSGEQDYSVNQDTVTVKMEPDVDLTIDDTDEQQQAFSELSFGQGGAVFPNQAFGQMPVDNASGTAESGLAMFSGQNNLFAGEGGGSDMSTFGDVGFSGLPAGMDDSSENADKKRQCDICRKIFVTARHLEEHKQIHTGYYDQKFEKSGFGGDYKRSHLVTIGNEKFFPCDICGRGFRDQRNMKRHRLVHTGERPHACDVCGVRFSRVDNLKTHRLKHML